MKSNFCSRRSTQIKKLKKTNQVQNSISHQNPSVQVLILKFGSSGPISQPCTQSQHHSNRETGTAMYSSQSIFQIFWNCEKSQVEFIMRQWKRFLSGNSIGDDDDDGYNLTLIISTIRQTRQASFHRIGQLFPNQTIMNLTNHLSWNLVILEHFGTTVACVRKYAQLC